MRFLLRHIDRMVIVFGLMALMVLSMRTLQSVALVASEVTVQPEMRRVYGDLTVLYTLNAGNNKPIFLNRQGDALIEYSAWASFVTVDGTTLDLWSHAFNVHVDKETNRMYLTISSGRAMPQRSGEEPKRYQIEQQVDVVGKTARVRYYFIPNQPVDTVRLTLGHYGWYFERLRVLEGVVTFDRSNLTRDRYEHSDVPSRYTPVTLRPGPGGKIEVLRSQFGPYAFNVTYVLRSPAPYEKTLIAEEEVRF